MPASVCHATVADPAVAIFPTESMPVFNNVANLGLLIFLFLVALEVRNPASAGLRIWPDYQ